MILNDLQKFRRNGDNIVGKKSKKKNKKNMIYVKSITTPTHSEIAEIFNMDFKDIDKSFKELIDAGLIEVDGDVTHIYMPVARKI